MSERTCYQCGGDVVLEAREGREVCWRERVGFAVPASLAIPTCLCCGEWQLTDAVTEAIDAACYAQWAELQLQRCG